MGLDMYLKREVYIGNNYKDKKEQFSIDVPGVDQKSVVSVIVEAGYWRKANAIHKWFVDNVQDGVDNCGRYYVSNENLQDLLDVVKKVLKDHKLATSLLPTKSGFFFGDQSIENDYYFEMLKDTKNILEAAVKEEKGEFYYASSW